MSSMIYRNKYENLEKWRKTSERKPLILKGPRQVGKTFLIKEFGKSQFPLVHYFNFEEDAKLGTIFEPDLKPKRILDDLSLYQNKTISQRDLVIFDEIQACPLALTSLKYFCESMPDRFIVAAGSLLGLHFNSSFPVGKVEFLDLAPLCFAEFLLALNETKLHEKLSSEGMALSLPDAIHHRLWNLLKTYFVVGGMPEVVSSYAKNMNDPVKAFSEARSIQNSLITSYTNDIAKHSGKLSGMNIERVWKSVPAQLSSSIDGRANKYRFKDVLSGQKGFRDLSGPIDWIKKAGLVLQVKIVNSGLVPSYAYTKENRFKLMLHDVGLLGAMCKLEPRTILSWEFGTFKGFFAENFVAQELDSCGIELFCWEEGKAEIEFLIQSGDDNVPVEVKSGKNINKAKSLVSFTKKYEPSYSIIFSSNLPAGTNGKILKMPLYLAGFLSQQF
jgi:uncharacterized protein